MKKKILICSFLFFGIVQADSNEFNNTKSVNTTSDKSGTVDENFAINNNSASGSSFDGFYLGLGVQYSHWSNKIKATDGMTVLGDSIQVNTDISSQQIDKFGGSIIASYTKSFGKFYLGGEFLFDVNKDHKTNSTYVYEDAALLYSSKVKGVVPSVSVRIGYVCPKINSPVYAKFGVSWLHAEYQERNHLADNNIIKMNKFAPTIGLGFEKKIYDRFNLCSELDYKIQVKRTGQVYSRMPACQYNVENRLKGFTFRIMLIRKFDI